MLLLLLLLLHNVALLQEELRLLRPVMCVFPLRLVMVVHWLLGLKEHGLRLLRLLGLKEHGLPRLRLRLRLLRLLEHGLLRLLDGPLLV